MPTTIAGVTLYSLKEVAEGLGISYQTAKNWVSSGKIKATQIGRAYRVEETELKRLIQSNGQSAQGADNSGG
jgi:excisionase family DNA binding protein